MGSVGRLSSTDGTIVVGRGRRAAPSVRRGGDVAVVRASSSSSDGASMTSMGGVSGGLAGFLDEPIAARAPNEPSPELINEDLAPVLTGGRTFTTYDIAALWIGLVVCVPAYTLAGSVIGLGMSASQGIACILLANCIVLAPMIANGHAGTKYGVPFPVLARSAFGVSGANVPGVMRALVGCGWFGIQTHVGGQAIFALIRSAVGMSAAPAPAAMPFLGISAPELACYAFFWATQVAIVCKVGRDGEARSHDEVVCSWTPLYFDRY